MGVTSVARTDGRLRRIVQLLAFSCVLQTCVRGTTDGPVIDSILHDHGDSVQHDYSGHPSVFVAPHDSAGPNCNETYTVAYDNASGGIAGGGCVRSVGTSKCCVVTRLLSGNVKSYFLRGLYQKGRLLDCCCSDGSQRSGCGHTNLNHPCTDTAADSCYKSYQSHVNNLSTLSSLEAGVALNDGMVAVRTGNTELPNSVADREFLQNVDAVLYSQGTSAVDHGNLRPAQLPQPRAPKGHDEIRRLVQHTTQNQAAVPRFDIARHLLDRYTAVGPPTRQIGNDNLDLDRAHDSVVTTSEKKQPVENSPLDLNRGDDRWYMDSEADIQFGLEMLYAVLESMPRTSAYLGGNDVNKDRDAFVIYDIAHRGDTKHAEHHVRRGDFPGHSAQHISTALPAPKHDTGPFGSAQARHSMIVPRLVRPPEPQAVFASIDTSGMAEGDMPQLDGSGKPTVTIVSAAVGCGVVAVSLAGYGMWKFVEKQRPTSSLEDTFDFTAERTPTPTALAQLPAAVTNSPNSSTQSTPVDKQKFNLFKKWWPYRRDSGGELNIWQADQSTPRAVDQSTEDAKKKASEVDYRRKSSHITKSEWEDVNVDDAPGSAPGAMPERRTGLPLRTCRTSVFDDDYLAGGSADEMHSRERSVEQRRRKSSRRRVVSFRDKGRGLPLDIAEGEGGEGDGDDDGSDSDHDAYRGRGRSVRFSTAMPAIRQSQSTDASRTRSIRESYDSEVVGKSPASGHRRAALAWGTSEPPRLTMVAQMQSTSNRRDTLSVSSGTHGPVEGDFYVPTTGTGEAIPGPDIITAARRAANHSNFFRRMSSRRRSRVDKSHCGMYSSGDAPEGDYPYHF